MSKAVLVTGGHGWLGQQIVDDLLAGGNKAVATGIPTLPEFADGATPEQRSAVVSAKEELGDRSRHDFQRDIETTRAKFAHATKATS